MLYVDEVNLLPDHLADALLDAVASGVHVARARRLQRGAGRRFVLVGIMNPEEGALRPQLLDRFALAVDVAAPMEPRVRRDAIERRLALRRRSGRRSAKRGAKRARDWRARLSDARARVLERDAAGAIARC